jgi:hypothetical protein
MCNTRPLNHHPVRSAYHDAVRTSDYYVIHTTTNNYPVWRTD